MRTKDGYCKMRVRAYSSIGQSSGLIIRWFQVQVLVGPPLFSARSTRRIDC